MNTIKSAAWTMLLLALALPAFAEGKGPRAVRKQVELSMVVTGKVRIDDAGHVQGLEVDRESELPAAVAGLIRGSVTKWEFEPLRPGQTAAASPMAVRVVARQAPDEGKDKFTMRIVSASFGETPREEMPNGIALQPPVFPASALSARVPATVYLVARVGRDGKVQDIVAEQVNLRAVGSEQQMIGFRKQFADASIATAKRWKFAPPTQGEDAGAADWVVRVPVDFLFDLKRPAYGQWEAYVPGPRQRALWNRFDQGTAGVDAFSSDRPQLLGRGPRLLTALEGNG
ncbi:MAG: energy transducer TonB [Lysobacter sp.]